MLGSSLFRRTQVSFQLLGANPLLIIPALWSKPDLDSSLLEQTRFSLQLIGAHLLLIPVSTGTPGFSFQHEVQMSGERRPCIPDVWSESIGRASIQF